MAEWTSTTSYPEVSQQNGYFSIYCTLARVICSLKKNRALRLKIKRALNNRPSASLNRQNQDFAPPLSGLFNKNLNMYQVHLELGT